MITLFTIPRPFEGHFNIIQRNALKSWSLLSKDYEIILFGNEKGVAQAAKEFGFKHVPEFERNEFGTPLLSFAFNEARKIARHDIIAALTGDIILMSDFKDALEKAAGLFQKKDFLIVGGRYDFDLTEELDFKNPSWEKELKQRVAQTGNFRGYAAIDYFVYPKDQIKDFPPFIIGAVGWDSWLIYHTRLSEIPVIDITPMVTVVHQNHPHPRKGKEFFKEEIEKNYQMAGGFLNMMTLREADFLLTKNGLERPKFPRSLFSRFALFYPWRWLLFIKRKINNLISA